MKIFSTMEGQHNTHNGTQHTRPRLCHNERVTRAQYILTPGS